MISIKSADAYTLNHNILKVVNFIYAVRSKVCPIKIKYKLYYYILYTHVVWERDIIILCIVYMVRACYYMLVGKILFDYTR